MAVTTVRPNATASGASLFTISGGSATTHAALNDNNTATFIAKSSSVTGQASILLDFGTTTISASQRVKRVRARAEIQTPDADGRINFYLGTRTDNQNYFHSASAVRGQQSRAVVTGPWQTASPNGASWSQATINGLRMKLTEYNDSTDVANIYEAFIDVDIAAQPTVTVSAPTGTITTSAAPDTTWAFADTDGETQAFYQIKVFSAAQYGAGGFSPATSTATYNSGEIASTDNTAVIGELLLPAVYRAYVRTAKNINGEPFWSEYAFSQFTISYTAPTTPTLTASWSDTLGRAALTVTGATLAGTGYVSQYFDVHRSDDSGTIFEGVRNGEDITPSASFVGVVNDYEAPRGVVAYYRARAIGVDSSDNEFPTAWTSPVQVLVTNDETWWFKVVEDPTLNLGSVRVLADLDVNIEEPNTIFRPLGENRPIIVAGPLQGEDGIYNVKTLTEDEWDDFYPILTYQGTLLVQDPLGNQKYVRIIQRNFIAETVAGLIHRTIDAAYVQVDAVLSDYEG